MSDQGKFYLMVSVQIKPIKFNYFFTVLHFTVLYPQPASVAALLSFTTVQHFATHDSQN